MIENIKNNQISDILRQQPSLQKTDLPQAEPQIINSDSKNETLIDKAMQTTLEDPSAVIQAKQLLLSGQLDSPENIRKAAENMIKFGI